MSDPGGQEVAESLELQLSEVEMLSSMFPRPGEFIVEDGEECMAQIQAFLDGNIPYDQLDRRVGFIVKLEISDQQKVELVCRLPHEYPSVLPQVFTRASALSREQHRALSERVQTQLETLPLDQLLITPLLQWFQESAATLLSQIEQETTKNSTKTEDAPEKPPQSNKFSRMWIYSHHIYSKIKRKDILEFSSELDLSGFCMPGKPGIIVIEGHNDDVEDFWGRIRRMQWKKLTMKEKEDSEVTEGKTVDDLRKFKGFEEKYFEPRQGKGRGAHADRGLLYQFLEERGCGSMFGFYFHVDGKLAEAEDD